MMKRVFVFLVFFFGGSLLASDLLKAYVNKVSIEAGESIILNIEYLVKDEKKPRLNELQEKFVIISQSESTETSFVNGNSKFKHTWTLELIPKSSAQSVIIPAIVVGSYATKPITIAQGKSAKPKSKGVELKVSLDRSTVYVNSELLITIEIKSSLTLRNGNLSQLKIEDAIVLPVIEDKQSEVVENGIKYMVFTRSFAVFPNNPGELKIAPVIFEGVAITSNGWPFFSGGERVTARSEELLVNVLDVPETFPKNQPFLAAKNLVVIEDMASTKFFVNQATSRTFEIRAQGALTSFLPEIIEPKVKDLQVYTESKPKEQVANEDGILSSQKLTHTYMPLEPGPMIIPEQTIYWWDTEKDELRETVIRKLEFNVEGVSSFRPAEKPAEANENEPEPESDLELSPTKSSFMSKYIVWIIAAVIIDVLIALFLWWWRKHYQKISKNKPQNILKSIIKAIKSACDRGDRKSLYQNLEHLLDFSRKHHLAVSEELLKDIQALEASIYRSGGEVDEDLISRIKPQVLGIRFKKSAKVYLPPLYPS